MLWKCLVCVTLYPMTFSKSQNFPSYRIGIKSMGNNQKEMKSQGWNRKRREKQKVPTLSPSPAKKKKKRKPISRDLANDKGSQEEYTRTLDFYSCFSKEAEYMSENIMGHRKQSHKNKKFFNIWIKDQTQKSAPQYIQHVQQTKTDLQVHSSNWKRERTQKASGEQSQ